MYAQTPPYREKLEELTEVLRSQGSLGLLLIDATDLAHVERHYGSKAFDNVLSMTTELVQELRGEEVRNTDLLALNERGGNAFLVFLAPKRADREGNTRVSDLRAAATRVEEHLNRKLAQLPSPYLQVRREVSVGFSLVFFNPLIMPERLLARLVEEAWECTRIQKAQLAFNNRCKLQEILLADQINTVFQPLVNLQQPGVLGFEALARGPAGTSLHAPYHLFKAATESDLVFELDRHCRRKAFQTAKELPATAKLFVNVFPPSMYDPDFRGNALINLLEGLGLSPDRIVLEISEEYAIENYFLFVEALQNFTQLGFTIAVDDIGAGHSGLEKIAHLEPRYLKFDMHLVSRIDESYMKREMARALKAFADKMDAKTIAEGIEREEELQVCVELGIDLGQGYLLGRPADISTFVPSAASSSTPS
jgi:EAL domain-containing protein (putative c-di-GMP-specific phosphodiesterase class I)/GGDEF domain-containing protein